MDEVAHKCDVFLSYTQSVEFLQKLLMVDKYGLPETKKACLTSPKLQDREFIQDLKKKPDYKKISAELKIELLEKSIDSLTGIIVCDYCGTKFRDDVGIFCARCDGYRRISIEI